MYIYEYISNLINILYHRILSDISADIYVFTQYQVLCLSIQYCVGHRMPMNNVHGVTCGNCSDTLFSNLFLEPVLSMKTHLTPPDRVVTFLLRSDF